MRFLSLLACLLCAGPKLIPKHTVVDHVVANIDIAPTLLDFAGAAGGTPGGGGLKGADPGRIIDGRSLAPLVAPSHAAHDPSRAPHPDGVFCEIYSDRSVVARDYALVDVSALIRCFRIERDGSRVIHPHIHPAITKIAQLLLVSGSLLTRSLALSLQLSRSHYTAPPYDRKPWGDRLQLYRLPDDAEMRSNLVTRVMAHTDPLAGHALDTLKATLASHLQDTVPACQRGFWPEHFPTKFVEAAAR